MVDLDERELLIELNRSVNNLNEKLNWFFGGVLGILLVIAWKL